MEESIENRIKLLPEYIANQIAAGEVVQRPESVVKELVENSLDAGANSIIISIRSAGKSLIHIIDNGAGMSREDLELSIRRHTTSKVFTSEDLEEIKTFGFRGEALASICSVANVEIRTKRPEDDYGWQLFSEPTKDVVIEPIQCDNGTQIFVRNLFYNVPARRKFLKTNMTEFRYISDTVIRLALSKPEIRFTFYDEDTLIFDVHSECLIERITKLLGNEVGSSLIECSYQNEFIKINGYIGEPHLTRQNRTGQYFFLNNRTIRSNSLYYAVASCYEELLDKSHKPIFVLNLAIDYSKVDVNVHPQKNEVKFDDEGFIYNSLKSAVMNALSSANYLSSVEVGLINTANPFEKIISENGDVYINKNTGEVINSVQEYGKSSFERNLTTDYNSKEVFKNSAFDDIFGKYNESQQICLDLPENKEDLRYSYIMNRFIVFENTNYIVIIDQASFSQRLIYDRIKKKLDFQNKDYSNQELLFPIILEISTHQATKVKKMISEIEKIGFRVELERNRLEFSALPDIISEDRAEQTIRKFIEELLVDEYIDSKDYIERICLSVAVAGAANNGLKLEDLEIRTMIMKLKNYKIPTFSPKGKKAVIKLTNQEFYNKLFFNS